jgi:hypothetical protein
MHLTSCIMGVTAGLCAIPLAICMALRLLHRTEKPITWERNAGAQRPFAPRVGPLS